MKSRHPVSMLVLLAVLRLGACSPTDDRTDALESRDLHFDSSHLPYVFEEYQARADLMLAQGGWVNGALFVDLDGDGDQEMVSARNPGIVSTSFRDDVYDTLEQSNLPVDYCWRTPCGSLDGLWDVDGDGRDELIVTASTEDRSRWRIAQLDPATLAERRAFEFSGGEDRRLDGIWDGTFQVVGAFTARVGEDDVPALAVLCEAGFDLEPRGVIALDARTGVELWRYLVGPKPATGQVLIADLDGDGRDEIVFGGVAVNNIKDRSYNGTIDDRPMVFALDDAGALLWRHELSPGTGSVQVRLVRDASGRAVGLLAGSSLGSAVGNALELLGVDGTVLDTFPLDAAVLSLHATAPATDPGRHLLSLRNGMLVDVRVVDGTIELVRWIDHPRIVLPILVADLLPAPGHEIVALTVLNQMILFDDALKPQAVLEGMPFRGVHGSGSVWRPEAGRFFVAVRGLKRTPGALYAIAPAARRIPWDTLGFAALGIVVLGGALRLRRRGRPPASTRRDLALQLLGRLELSSHGAIGALSSLRRLVWLVDVAASGDAVPLRVTERILSLTDDCRRHALPALQSSLDLAELAGLDTAVVGRARLARTTLEEALRTDPPGDAQILRSSVERLEQALQDLRSRVADEFRTDPVEGFARSLDAHRETIEGLAVEVVCESSGAPVCRIDREEFSFVLDNLVDNALRAMAGAVVRRLELAVSIQDGGVRLTVRDTGEGIVPDDWERIFQDGYSTRTGGGLGLARSRTLLRKYGGGLRVVESGPGRGTLFELVLPKADAAAGGQSVGSS